MGVTIKFSETLLGNDDFQWLNGRHSANVTLLTSMDAETSDGCRQIRQLQWIRIASLQN